MGGTHRQTSQLIDWTGQGKKLVKPTNTKNVEFNAWILTLSVYKTSSVQSICLFYMNNKTPIKISYNRGSCCQYATVVISGLMTSFDIFILVFAFKCSVQAHHEYIQLSHICQKNLPTLCWNNIMLMHPVPIFVNM